MKKAHHAKTMNLKKGTCFVGPGQKNTRGGPGPAASFREVAVLRPACRPAGATGGAPQMGAGTQERGGGSGKFTDGTTIAHKRNKKIHQI